MTYFILTSGEDGTDISLVDEAELLKRITPDKHGETYYGSDITFLSGVPRNDKGSWYDVPEGSVLIIRGEIVVPKTKAVAVKYELP
jgi:hypothetical protein